MIEIFVNTYLPRFFDWVVETSIMASILVGLIIFVKALLRDKLNPRWHYLLWMILIVRLLLPWSPDSSYSIYSILSYAYETTVSVQGPTGSTSENERMKETNGISEAKIITEEDRNAAVKLQKTLKGSNRDAIRIEEQKNRSISFHTFAFYIWLAGVIVFGFATYLVNRRLYRYIKRQPVMTDRRIAKIFETCKKSMSVQMDIPLLLTGEISSPKVHGCFRPRILLSSAYISQLTEQQLQHIFYHELAHIKRRDVALNWLMHSLLILNWFNPILWYAYSRMREDQELACDAFALTFLDEKEQISYGHTIISLLEYYSNHFQLPSLANLSRNKKTLKRRILMIKKFQEKSYRWSAIGLIAVVAISLLSLPNAQADRSNEKQKEQTAEKVTVSKTKKAETEGHKVVVEPLSDTDKGEVASAASLELTQEQKEEYYKQYAEIIEKAIDKKSGLSTELVPIEDFKESDWQEPQAFEKRIQAGVEAFLATERETLAAVSTDLKPAVTNPNGETTKARYLYIPDIVIKIEVTAIFDTQLAEDKGRQLFSNVDAISTKLAGSLVNRGAKWEQTFQKATILDGGRTYRIYIEGIFDYNGLTTEKAFTIEFDCDEFGNIY
ncbi:peptidase M56 [Bacillus sp. FJAT-29790]|uniref:M56 family metallopeptidase n=1 Tax=Bacillus sp. FJAT-29790 TaxID=1895002 RepID=UPI001C22E80D|nr:M56 family metallopeptidase [Bacillus sp. FJAT-29790]MBU8881329.1 peptidase M56 [Bacillus sp. FJAT-29790]